MADIVCGITFDLVFSMKRKIIISLFLSAFVLASSLAQAQGARRNNNGQSGYSQPGNYHNQGRDRGFHQNHHHYDRNVYASNRGNVRVNINYGNACTPRYSQRLLFDRGRFYQRTRFGFREVIPPIGYYVDFIPVRRSTIYFHRGRKHFVFKGIVYQRLGRGFEVVGIETY